VAPEGPPADNPEVRSEAHGSSGATMDPEAGAHEHLSGAVESEDVIRDQREVFEMARERYGLRDPNGGR
jgi:hypothetical protein